MFSIGDKIKIIHSPPEDKKRGPEWIKEMNQTCGQIGTINTGTMYQHGNWYILKEHPQWWFLEDWLLPTNGKRKVKINLTGEKCSK